MKHNAMIRRIRKLTEVLLWIVILYFVAELVIYSGNLGSNTDSFPFIKFIILIAIPVMIYILTYPVALYLNKRDIRHNTLSNIDVDYLVDYCKTHNISKDTFLSNPIFYIFQSTQTKFSKAEINRITDTIKDIEF